MRGLLLVILAVAAVLAGVAQARVPMPELPAAAQAAPLDPSVATRVWLDTQPAAQRAKTDAYFEGGYWVRLWSAMVVVASSWLLLASGASCRLRAWAERVTARRALQVALFSIGILPAISLLSLPWSIYTDWWREHQYGLSNQSFSAWAGEADRLRLAASREPDGFAAAALKLGEYRKMEPSQIEEAIFFTHPSGRARIEMAMRRKAEAQRQGAAQ